MKKYWIALIVVATTLGTMTWAQAQPPGRPGGFPGPPGPPGGGAPGRLAMLTTAEVQAELKLTGEQKKTVADASEKMQQDVRGLFEQNAQNAPADGPPPFERIGQEIEAIGMKAEESVIASLDEQQKKRYSELRIQQAGGNALLQPEVVKALELKDEQLEEVRGRLSGVNPFMAPEERDVLEKQILAVLTDPQKSRLEELKGVAFQFPPQGFGGPGGFGPPGGGGPGFGPPGMGGPGGMMGQERKLVAEFDKDGNGWLNKDERAEARKSLQTNGGGRGRGFGPPGGFGGREEEPVSPGPKISPSDVTASDAPLYDPKIVRTLFLNFEGEDWESEMEAFNNTDVELPATLIADGKTYENVGVHFRGMSSFGMVQSGHKRSLNLSMDFIDEDQKLHGYKTLNLLNSHEDPSFMHTTLYLDAARSYIPAAKANFVRVVINGESWGPYVSAQQFNKEFVKENFGTAKGTCWKVPGSPMGRGGLEYLGDDISAYERIYSMKTGDGEKSWKKLIALCKTLNETPPEKLEAALSPMLDIDGTLWFLALENALINSDGYWVRASDYCIFLDADGKFHILPHDTNETFQPGMGPGIGRGGRGGPGGFGPGGFGPGGFGPGGQAQRPPVEGEPDRPPGGAPGEVRPGEGRVAEGRGGRSGQRGPGGMGPGGMGPGGMGPGGMGGGVTLDPLVGLNDASKPLRSKLLAVPELRQRYLSFVRTIAEDWLDWNKLQPLVDGYAQTISPYVQADTRKLSSYQAFLAAVSSEVAAQPAGGPGAPAAGPGDRVGGPGGGGPGPGGRGSRLSLRQFAEQRSKFLLSHAEVQAAKRVDYKRPLPVEKNE